MKRPDREAPTTRAGGLHLRSLRPAPGATVTALLLLALLAGGRREAHAQFSDPCAVACALTLGASSFVLATGVVTAVGRLEGGYTTQTRPAVTWGAAFVVSAGAGIALQGDGGRQRRAVYGSAIGAASGALLGLAAESVVGDGSEATRWAATLIGGGLGVLAGGVLGATSYEGPAAPSPAFTFVSPPVAFPLGR